MLILAAQLRLLKNDAFFLLDSARSHDHILEFSVRQFSRLFCTASLVLLPALNAISASNSDNPSGHISVIDTLPLTFEENVGQFDESVKFLSRGPGFNVYLTSKAALISLMPTSPMIGAGEVPPLIRMLFDGANDSPAMIGADTLAFKTSYFRGSSPTAQYIDIKNHARVAYKELYAGIDLSYYSKDRNMEFDFKVMPRARPEQIRLRFSGMDAISLPLPAI